MKHDQNGHVAYGHELPDDTDRYVQDLLAENETLHRRLSGMETATAVLTRQKTRLKEQVVTLRCGVERDLRKLEHSRRLLADAEAQSRIFSDRYVQVEQQNSDLANLYVACYRLHGTLDRQEVLAAIQEVIINLIGCEELGIFELEGSVLQLSACFGLEADRYRSIPLGSGLIGRAAASGERFLAGSSDDAERRPEEAHLTTCIPLEVDGRVTGALALFRLLPQKAEGLGALDHQLFDLLATQAGVALYSSALQMGGDSPAGTPMAIFGSVATANTSTVGGA